MEKKDFDKIEVWVWILFALGFGLLIFFYSRPIASRKDIGDLFSPSYVARSSSSPQTR